MSELTNTRWDRTASLWGRSAVILLLVLLSIPFFTRNIIRLGDYDYFLHKPLLVIHEAGHVIFGIVGNELLMVLGGSLMQVLMPLILMIAFLWKRDFFAAAAMCWWAGQSLVDVAPYINDARMLQLPLLGGGTGREIEGHDWEFILTRLGCLNADIYLARGVLAAGRAWMLMALAWAATVLALQWRKNAAAGTGRPVVLRK